MKARNQEMEKVVCDRCGGSGFIEKRMCSKCHGDGKLDWIENVIGKKGRYFKPGIYVQEVDYSSY